MAQPAPVLLSVRAVLMRMFIYSAYVVLRSCGEIVQVRGNLGIPHVA